MGLLRCISFLYPYYARRLCHFCTMTSNSGSGRDKLMKSIFQSLARATFLIFALFLVGCDLSNPSGLTPTPAPVETLSVSVDRQGQAAAGPQVVQQTPLKGERLSLQPLIHIVFDRDMDQAKTRAAWTFLGPDGKALAGQSAWLDARTFEFRPSLKLQPSARYVGAFSMAAAGADGKTPCEEIRLEFHSLDALAVGQVFPADKTEDVDVSTNITLIFNRPIVPVNIVEEQTDLPQPVLISPQVPGHGEWVNSSVYVFQPDELLHSGTRYQVRVAAGLSDTTGNTLPADYNWQFQTRAPQISHYSLKDGIQDPTGTIENVLLDQAFIVDFVQPMEAASVARAVMLVNRETGKPFPTSLKWNKEFTELVIQPVGRYAIGSFYDLTLADSAQAKGGGTLKAGLAIHFSSVPMPRIESVSPKPGSADADFSPWVAIQFASPMNFASLEGKVKISPQPAKEPTLYYDQYQWRLNLSGLQPATDYVVRLLPGAVDIYGNAIKSEYPFNFKTGNLSANAQMLLPWNPLVYREKGAQEFFFSYTNLNTATFSLYRLSFDEFSAQTQGGDKLLNFSSSNKPVREWQAPLQPLNNKHIQRRVELQDDHGKPLSPGYYFIGLKASPLSYYTTFYQGAVFVVATDNITFKTTPNEALAWVVDLEKGRPVANVPVAVYNRNYTRIGTTTTGKDGLAYLKGLIDPYMVQLDDKQHVAVSATACGSGVSAYDFVLCESDYTGTASTPFAYG